MHHFRDRLRSSRTSCLVATVAFATLSLSKPAGALPTFTAFSLLVNHCCDLDVDVFQVNPITGATTTFSSGANVDIGIAVNATGDVFVTTPGGGSITRIDPTTGAQTTVSSGGSFRQPEGVAVGAGGDLFVADAVAKAIFRVDPITGAQSTVSSGGFLTEPFDIVADASGTLFVSNVSNSFGGLVEVDPITGAQRRIIQTQLFWGLGLDGGENPLVTEPAFQELLRVDPATGVTTTISSGGALQFPFDVVMGPDGNLYVTDPNAANGSVFRIDPTTGTQTVVASELGRVSGIAISFIPEPCTAVLLGFGLMGLNRSMMRTQWHRS